MIINSLPSKKNNDCLYQSFPSICTIRTVTDSSIFPHKFCEAEKTIHQFFAQKDFNNNSKS